MTSQPPIRPASFGKGILRFLLAAVAVLLFFLLVIEGLARLSWNLSGSNNANLAQIAAIPAPDRHPDKGVCLPSFSEWKGGTFQEAPALAALVAKGELPPVAQRLPVDPQVITPAEQMGPYGGTWRRFGTDVADIQTYAVHRIPYPNMLRWSPMGDRILPNIATRWKIEDGAKTYTLWLRKGIKWSDGVPFTADDIMFWYQHVLLNEDLTPSVAREYKRGGETLTVEKVDDYCVRFRFKAPHGRFLQNLAGMPGYEMIDVAAHYFKKFHPDFESLDKLNAEAKKKKCDFWHQRFNQLRDWTNSDAPRLWPWIVKAPPPARPIVLERNPYFWKVDPQGRQLPYMDRVTFEIFDPETINLKAINGEIGMQNRHIRFDNYPLFMANREKGHYRVLHWIDTNGGTNNLALNMNSKDPVKAKLFNDKRFRIALSLAINRDEINEVCFFGIGKPRQCSPMPTSAFYSREYEQAYTKHDPAQANALLDEIGLTKKNRDGIRLRPDGKPLSVQIDALEMASHPKALELVTRYWTAVGVKAELKLLARQLFYQRKNALMHDVNVWYGADEMNPVLDPRWFFPWNNESNQGIAYSIWFRSGGKKGIEPPKEIQQCMEIYSQIEQTPDDEEKRKLFMRIIDINQQNLWVIGTIGEVPALYIVSNSFRNVPEVAVSGWQFRGPANAAPECFVIDEGGK